MKRKKGTHGGTTRKEIRVSKQEFLFKEDER